MSRTAAVQPVAAITRVTPHGDTLDVTAQGQAGSRTYLITPAMAVLGSSGQPMDRQALQVGDILLYQPRMVRDESVDTATVKGTVALAQVAQRFVVLQVAAMPLEPSAQRCAHPRRHGDVVFVLLTASPRLLAPHGQGLTDVQPGQVAQARGAEPAHIRAASPHQPRSR